MSEEGEDSKYHHHHEQPPQYGTFQGAANYPQQPAIGFPQPVPPPGVSGPSPMPPSQHYAHGYQAVPGYAVPKGTRERRLPCCGIGMGWFLFIVGFFLAAIPWYVAVFILLCARIDHREKPGYIACTIAGVLAIVAIILGVTESEW